MVSLQEIERVLDQSVRPLLHAHQGDVEVTALDGDVLRCRMAGRCAGCPAADLTAEDLIQTEIRKRFPEIRQVVLVHEVSAALLEQARAILRDHHV